MGLPSSGSLKLRRLAASIRRVTLYHADGCRLCDRARRVIEGVRAEVSFEFDEVNIGGDPDLEAGYREWLPVVEIDGERAFVFYVDRDALIRRLNRPLTPTTEAGG